MLEIVSQITLVTLGLALLATFTRLVKGPTLPDRIVATDRRSPRDGRFIEQIGYYDPRKPEFNLDLARYEGWVKNGARRMWVV